MNHWKSETKSQLIRAKQAYYHGDKPIMSDEEFDKLEESYRKEYPDCDYFQMVGAPYDPKNNLTKIKHPIWSCMGSQFKINTAAELEKWAESCGATRFHISLKADGASLALYYEEGVLVKAVTRGNGVEGEDITANAVKMKGVPTSVTNSFSGVVRCEVVLMAEDWETVDPEKSTNPRNLGNGIMGRKDGTDSEFLTALAFDVARSNGRAYPTEAVKFFNMASMGFVTVLNKHQDNDQIPGLTITEVRDWYAYIVNTRNDLHYWIDGIIIRINDIAEQEQLGMRDNRPKGQRAWKFEAEEAETVLEHVELTVGHTGAIVPTGVFRPVQLGGTTVKRALLNNWDEINRLGIGVGSVVTIVKANDIIPKVIDVITPGEIIPEPTSCPVCGSGVSKDGAAVLCENLSCDAKKLGKIKRWVKSLNILHVGDGLLDALYESGRIKEIFHLYHLTVDDLSKTVLNAKTGMLLGDKRAKTAYDNLQKSREMSLSDFLGSLGIPFLGKRRAEKMIEAVPQLNVLANWLDGSLLEYMEPAGVPEVGVKMNEALVREDSNIDTLWKEIVIIEPIQEAEVTGSTFCITGKLPSGKKKKDFSEPLSSKGHKLVDKVDKTLDYLVMADPESTSSKAVKARKLGISIISEEDLEKMI